MYIHIYRDGQQYGPYSIEDTRAYLETGVLFPTDYAYHDGMADWAPLEQVLLTASQPVLPVVPTQSPPAEFGAQSSGMAVVQPVRKNTPKSKQEDGKKGKKKKVGPINQKSSIGVGEILKRNKTAIAIVVATVVIAVSGIYIYKGIFGSNTTINPEYGTAALDSALRKATGKAEGELTKEDLEKVTEFMLNNSRLTDADLATVAGLTQLKKLDLSFNGIKDVSALKSLTNLEELLLNENQLTDISALEELKHLKVLDVSNNFELGAVQIAKLQKKLRKCEIIHSAPR